MCLVECGGNFDFFLGCGDCACGRKLSMASSSNRNALGDLNGNTYHGIIILCNMFAMHT